MVIIGFVHVRTDGQDIPVLKYFTLIADTDGSWDVEAEED